MRGRGGNTEKREHAEGESSAEREPHVPSPPKEAFYLPGHPRVSIHGEEREPERHMVDPETVRRARRGDPAAAETLVRALTPRLWRIAVRLLGDPALAEDLVTEALYRGISKLGRLREDRAAAAWFRSILVNLWRDASRRRGAARRRGATEVPMDEASEPAAPAAADPSLVAERRETEDLLAAEVRRLPPAQRAVLALRLEGDLSAAEIAEALGTTADRVKANLWHARRTLRERLGRILDGSGGGEGI